MLAKYIYILAKLFAEILCLKNSFEEGIKFKKNAQYKMKLYAIQCCIV